MALSAPYSLVSETDTAVEGVRASNPFLSPANSLIPQGPDAEMDHARHAKANAKDTASYVPPETTRTAPGTTSSSTPVDDTTTQLSDRDDAGQNGIPEQALRVTGHPAKERPRSLFPNLNDSGGTKPQKGILKTNERTSWSQNTAGGVQMSSPSEETGSMKSSSAGRRRVEIVQSDFTGNF